MSDTRTRCPNKHPGTRGQCGLPAGHDGDHTLLVESGAPWFFPPVSPVASSATPTPDGYTIATATFSLRSENTRLADALASSQQEVERLKTAITFYVDAWDAKDAADCSEPPATIEHLQRRGREKARAFGALRRALEVQP